MLKNKTCFKTNELIQNYIQSGDYIEPFFFILGGFISRVLFITCFELNVYVVLFFSANIFEWNWIVNKMIAFSKTKNEFI